MTVRYDEAMHHAYRGRNYGVTGPNYEDINWFEEDEPMPTREELEAVWAEISDRVNRHEVDMTRAFEYPTIEELTVALWKALVVNGDLTSDAIEDIQRRREQVRENNPRR